MKRDKRLHPRSLRTKMLLLMLVCWLLPVAMVIGNMGYFMYNNYHNRAKEEISGGLATGLRITADQLNGAVSDILRPGYDGTIRDAWLKWSEGGYGWTSLYDSTARYLRNQYQRDARFPLVTFWFAEAPEDMRVGLYIEEAGGSQKLLSSFWQEDFAAIRDYAPELGTYTGFYQSGERIYLVRNLMNNRFQIIGTQTVALDMSVFTEGLSRLAWGNALCIWIDDYPAVIRGEAPKLEQLNLSPGDQEAVSGTMSGGGRYYYDSIAGDGYRLSALLQVDRSQMLAGIQGYQIILVIMALLLGPMLLIYYRLYERNITEPMRLLMAGAAQIEGGDLGYQMQGHAGSMEFRYIIDAFNRMSGQLRAQFEHIYREELSLRDARIKALQSQINPHFLNNTLEIINWEARIGGNAKVSQMIEALSTLLDAAMDRDRRQEVRLAEELRYINAYLFIIDQRFGKRLTVTRDISPDTLDCMVPRLILQPVVENAVEHGIGPAGTGQVALNARLEEDGALVLEVENDGVLSEEDRERIGRLLSPDYDASKESSYSLGIANVNQRLRILYGPRSGLELHEREGGGIIARLLIAQERA